MSASPALQRRPESLQVARRGGREALEIAIPFVLRDGARTLAGRRLSLRRIHVERDEIGRIGHGAPERDVEIQVTLDGFDAVLPVRVAPAAAGQAESGVLSFDIVGMDRRTEATLAQLIRTSLTGWLPAADDLTETWDEETPHHGGGAPNPIRTGVHWTVLVAALLVLVTGIAVAGHECYHILATVRSANAAVTAQRIDILSPEYGVVAEGAVPAGTAVTAGDSLIRVRSDFVEAAIALETAGGEPPSAGLTADAAEDARAAGRLRALNRRAEALAFTSRCTCTVLWSAPPGVPVAPGALLMSLVVSDPAEVRVEAAIPANQAHSVQPGQRAEVTLSGDDRAHRGVVEAVRFDSVPIPKVGLSAPRGMVVVTIALDDPAVALVPGRPASVVIRK